MYVRERERESESESEGEGGREGESERERERGRGRGRAFCKLTDKVQQQYTIHVQCGSGKGWLSPCLRNRDQTSNLLLAKYRAIAQSRTGAKVGEFGADIRSR